MEDAHDGGATKDCDAAPSVAAAASAVAAAAAAGAAVPAAVAVAAATGAPAGVGPDGYAIALPFAAAAELAAKACLELVTGKKKVEEAAMRPMPEREYNHKQAKAQGTERENHAEA